VKPLECRRVLAFADGLVAACGALDDVRVEDVDVARDGELRDFADERIDLTAPVLVLGLDFGGVLVLVGDGRSPGASERPSYVGPYRNRSARGRRP
jgi:hypothetical protein